MCIGFDGHHSDGSSFVYANDFCYYRICLYIHKYKFSSEKEQVNESPSILSRAPDPVRIRYSGRTRNWGVTGGLLYLRFFEMDWSGNKMVVRCERGCLGWHKGPRAWPTFIHCALINEASPGFKLVMEAMSQQCIKCGCNF